MSSCSSWRMWAMPAFSSSWAIQCLISYSFPSSYGPIFKPASWISGQLRLIIILMGEFSKMKSMFLMGVSDFGVVNVSGHFSFSQRMTAKRKGCFLDLNVTVEIEVNRLEDKFVCLGVPRRRGEGGHDDP